MQKLFDKIIFFQFPEQRWYFRHSRKSLLQFSGIAFSVREKVWKNFLLRFAMLRKLRNRSERRQTSPRKTFGTLRFKISESSKRNFSGKFVRNLQPRSFTSAASVVGQKWSDRFDVESSRTLSPKRFDFRFEVPTFNLHHQRNESKSGGRLDQSGKIL